MKREAKIGLFALLMLLALYWGVNFLKGKDLLSKNTTYYATYDQVNGMQTSSPVFIRGYKIGMVSNIEFDQRHSDRVVLEFTVKKEFKIPVNSRAKIFSNGIMGGKAVEIELGDAAEYLHKGDTIISAVDRDIMETAGSELEFFKQKINVLVTDMSQTLNSLNSLIETNASGVETTVSNLSSMSGSLDALLREGHDDIRDIVANLNALSTALSERSENIGGIIENVGAISDSLRAADLAGVVNNLSATLGELNGILSRVESGEGSLGKLLHDDSLYDSLTSASANLSLLLEDLKAHPGRYINISVFGGKKEKK